MRRALELESRRNKSGKQQERCAFQQQHEPLWRRREFSAPRTATVQTQPENTDFTYLKSFSDVSSAALCLSDSSCPSQKTTNCLQSSDTISGRKLSQSSEAAERMRQVPKPDPLGGEGEAGPLLKVSVQSTLTSKEKIKRL